MLSYEIRLGNKTAKELIDRNGRQLHDAHRAPLNIPPGKSCDVNVGNAYPDYSSTLEGMLHGNAPRTCNIRILAVWFSDETGWAGDSFFRYDSEARPVQIAKDGFFDK